MSATPKRTCWIETSISTLLEATHGRLERASFALPSQPLAQTMPSTCKVTRLAALTTGTASRLVGPALGVGAFVAGAGSRPQPTMQATSTAGAAHERVVRIKLLLQEIMKTSAAFYSRRCVRKTGEPESAAHSATRCCARRRWGRLRGNSANRAGATQRPTG